MYIAVALFFITNLFSLYRLSTFPPPPDKMFELITKKKTQIGGHLVSAVN